MAKIIIVDGNSEIREFAARFFQERNFEVYTAGAGKEALDIIREQRPGIALLDIRIEDMGGLNVLKRIRELSPNTKIIIVTNVDDMDVMDETRKLGVVAYLNKPILLNQLLDIVTRNMGARRSFFTLKVEPKE